jgi:hypothetical protein
MASPQDIEKLIIDLQQAKVMNADMTLNQALAAVSKSTSALLSAPKAPGGPEPDWYVAGGSHYVLVCPD